MIKGILVFDYNIYKQLKRFNFDNNDNYKIVYINNFNYYQFDYENNKLVNFEIEPKISKASYLMKELSGITEIYSIINNNDYYHFLTYSLKNLLTWKPIILGINLLEVSKENFINSINNSYPLNKEIYNNILLKTIVKNISRKYIGLHIKDIIDKYVPLSYNELSFLIYLYSLKENSNQKYIFQEIKNFKNIGYKDFNLNSNYITIIKNIKKLFPTIEDNKIIEKINNFYYGLENRNFNNIITYNFNLLKDFQNLLLNNKEKIKENIEIKNNYQDFYINVMLNDFHSLLDKNIFITIFILNLLKIGKLEFIEEEIIYKSKKENFIKKYYTPYITKELVETLKQYKIEIFNIETIINDSPKIKIINTKKNHISKSFLYKEELFELYDLDIKYFNYFLDKLENNGLIKIKNTNIEFTNKCIYLIENLTLNLELNTLENINKFYNKLQSTTLSKEKIIKYTNMLFDKYFPNLINNKPTFKQINLIKKLIKDNNLEDLNINNITNKLEANQIINKYLKPTEKQKEFAKNIGKKLNIKIEEECLNNKTCIETFIKNNKQNLYKKPTEKMINFAKKLSKEHNIPLSNDILEDFYKTQKFINKII